MKNKREKKKIKVELIYESTEENKFLLSQALNILLPKELIKNYLVSKNRVAKPKIISKNYGHKISNKN